MAKIMISRYTFQHRIKLGDTLCVVREGGRFYRVGEIDVHEDFEIDPYSDEIPFSEDEIDELNKAIDGMENLVSSLAHQVVSEISLARK